MLPLDGGITPDRIFSSVDLPAPFSPSRPRISLGRTSSETSMSAVTPEKCLVTPSTERSGGDDAVGSTADKHCSRIAIGSGTAPPSVPPDISPTRGEISSFAGSTISITLAIGESRRDGQSPPKWGRCPAGQRGARQSATSTRHGPYSHFVSFNL